MSDYLEHYGVIGMKWGKRKASYNSGSSNNPNNKPVNISKTKEGLHQSSKIAKTGAQKLSNARNKKHSDDITKKAKTMSESDLRRLSDRMALEQRYVNLMKQTDVKYAKSNLEKTLDTIGKVTTTAATALTVYEAIQKFK